MVRLVLVRHGQTAANLERRIQGQGGAGLSPVGAEQAERTAAWLAAVHPGATVVSSDLQRSRETAAPIAARLGADVVTDEGLRERDFGAWTDQLVSDLAGTWPELAERWARGEDVVADVGGESSAQLTDRVVATLRRLVDGIEDGATLVCVTHGGPVWHGTHGLLDIEPPRLGPVANGSITRLTVADGVAVLDSWNELGHLPAELHTHLQVSHDRRRRDAPPVGR